MTEQGNPEQKPGEANPLLAGKYKSIEELEKGYWELSKAGMKEREARIRAEAMLEARASAPVPTGPDPLASALGEASIPIEALDARVEAKALGILQEVLKPMMQQQQAEMSIASSHPDWPGTTEIIKGLEPDAAESYKKLLAKAPEEAMELGYEAWKAKQSKAQAQTAVDPVTRQAASSPPKRGGGGQAAESAEDKARYKELLTEAVQTGDWTKFTRYRFGEQPWHKQIVEGEY